MKNTFTKDDILDKFLVELSKLGKLYRSPLNPSQFIYDDVSALEFDRFDKQNRKEVNLRDILALEKRKGVATVVLKDILKVADKLKYDLTLYAKPFGYDAMPKDKLIKWYKKNGFVTRPNQYGMTDIQDIEDYVLSDEDEGLYMTRKN